MAGSLVLSAPALAQSTPPSTPPPNVCPDEGPGTYVLRYSAEEGTLEAATPGTFPLGGQRIVVCVVDPDWRDSYVVSTSDMQIGREEGATRTFSVGEAADVQARGETTAQLRGQAAQAQASACSSEVLYQATIFLETHRARFLRLLLETISAPMSPDRAQFVRDALDDFRHPREPRSPAGAPTERPVCPPDPYRADAQSERRCSLEAFVNYHLLPRWLWLADGQWHVDRAAYESGSGCGIGGRGSAAPSGSFDATIPEAAAPAIAALSQAMQRAYALADLGDETLRALEPPQTVFDLGTFGDNRLALISVQRHRRLLVLRGGEARLDTRRRTTTKRQEVHGLTSFRLEPGLAFSLLRRPEYAVATNEVGDQVLAVRNEGLRVIDPAVFLSFYWCGLDLRVGTWQRSCQPQQSNFGWELLAHLPTITVGIPINSDILSERANFYVGLLVDWIPFVSIGGGVHLALSVPTLRQDVLVGDPVVGRQVSDLTENRAQMSVYFSIAISMEAFTALQGFQVSR